MDRGSPRQREKYLADALALLSGKLWLVQKFLGCITYFFLTTIYLIGSLAFFLKCAEEFQIDLGIFFISKIIKMYNLIITITLAKETTKVSQVMGLFLEKLETFKTF